jgi:TolB-like protein
MLEAIRSGELPSGIENLEGELLDGTSFNDETLDAWLHAERIRHHDLFADALSDIADTMEKSGDNQSALLAARCVLRLDPCHEPSHRTILRSYIESGRRAQALRHYGDLQALLKTHLDVMPDEETRNLVADIRDRPDQVRSIVKRDKKPKVAILPAVSLSDDREDSIVADTMTRMLIAELGRFSPLTVVAASTMFAFRARRLTVEELGKSVGADYVLEISFQGCGRDGWTLAQLVSVESGAQIWSRKFVGETAHAPPAADHLIQKIAGNLYQILMKHAAGISVTQPEEHVAEDKLYLHAFYHVERPTLIGMIRARRLCDRLLAMEPDHVLVRESLAWVNFHCSFNGWIDDPQTGFREARNVAEAGLGRDDREPYLLSVFGLAETYLGNTRQGMDGLRRAVALNPSGAEFHTWLGIGLTFSGLIEEAHTAFDLAGQVSPDYSPIFLFRGDAHFTIGKYQDAIACLDRFLMAMPEYNWARLLRAAAHQALGERALALQDVDHVRDNAPELNGQYLEKLLRARAAFFRQQLWPLLEPAGLPWSNAEDQGFIVRLGRQQADMRPRY